MAACFSEEETLIEEREFEMVSPSGGKPSWRIAHLLKPSLSTTQQEALNSQTLINFNPTKKPINPNLKTLFSKIRFNGWRCPQKKWNSWIEKLRPKFEPIWKKSSIYEPIMASTLEIPRCNDTLFALAERWNPETNSFVLPWGEVTITLEDVLVLGGYSVTGDSVKSENGSKELLEIEEKLFQECMNISRTKYRKTSHSPWMDVWMANGSEIEHEAFLSLWLSRYVLPADSYCTINKKVFQIAILLARGTKIALAPAVLASIYRDLRLLKAYIGTFGVGDHVDENVTKLNLWAPLQFLQVWVWERFPALSPKPNAITHGLPRLARWNKVKILREDDVGLAIDSAKMSFRWRPYTTPLNNWSCCDKFYPEKSMWVSVDSNSSMDLQSYARCIRVSELVELVSVQQYLPHRVAMQFGLDQDIPLNVPRSVDTCQIAWSYYNRPIRDVRLYIPSRLFESDVTARYLEWWRSNFEKGIMSRVKMENSNPSVSLFQSIPKGSLESAERLRIKIENNADVPPGFQFSDAKRKRLEIGISSDQPSSKRFEGSLDDHRSIWESNESNPTRCSAQVKKGETGNDSDSDIDHLTLSQLFRGKHTKGLNRENINGTVSKVCSESPLSSAGDNVSMREIKSATSPIPTPMSSNVKDTGRSLEGISQSAENDLEPRVPTQESTKLNLEARISRLQRIVDYFSPFVQMQRSRCSR